MKISGWNLYGPVIMCALVKVVTLSLNCLIINGENVFALSSNL